MTTSNDLHRCPAAVGTGAEFSTPASPAGVDAVACPLGGGKFVAGGSVHSGELLPCPSATPVATGVAGGREAPGGPDSPVESAPVASVEELRARQVAADVEVDHRRRDYDYAAQDIARCVVHGLPVADELRDEWRRCQAAWRAACEQHDVAVRAYLATFDGPAVAEGNDPHGIVRPVEARAL